MKTLKTELIIFIATAIFCMSCKKDISEPAKIKLTTTKIFNTLNPSSDAVDVSVLSNITVFTEKVINQENEYNEGNNYIGRYKIILDEFKVYSDSGEIKGSIIINNKNVKYVSARAFPAKTKIYVRLRAHYEEKYKNDTAYKAMVVDGKSAEDILESSFTTIDFDFVYFSSMINPANNSELTDIYTNFAITFKYAINKSATFSWLYGTYKPCLDYCKIFNNDIETEVLSTFNNDNTVINLKPAKSWVPNSKIKIILKTHWESLNTDNNWVKFYDDTLKLLTFNYNLTGKITSDTLRQEYIDYAYPVPRQCYFLKNEYSNGYLKLRFPIATITDNDTYSYYVNFCIKDSIIQCVQVNFSEPDMKFDYSLPGILKNETIYRLDFYKKNKSNNVSDRFFTYYFRTSKYSKFTDKMAAMSLQVWEWPVGTNQCLTYASTYGKTFECFDQAEANNKFVASISGNACYVLTGLVQIGAANWSSLDTFIYYVYGNYDTRTLKFQWRSKEDFGIPPYKTYYITQPDGIPVLSDSIIMSNSFSVSPDIFTEFIGYSDLVMTNDLYDLKDQIGTPTTYQESRLKTMRNSDLFNSTFRTAKLIYVLPGGIQTSQYQKVMMKMGK